jgi:hypothetical protein
MVGRCPTLTPSWCGALTCDFLKSSCESLCQLQVSPSAFNADIQHAVIHRARISRCWVEMPMTSAPDNF